MDPFSVFDSSSQGNNNQNNQQSSQRAFSNDPFSDDPFSVPQTNQLSPQPDQTRRTIDVSQIPNIRDNRNDPDPFGSVDLLGQSGGSPQQNSNQRPKSQFYSQQSDPFNPGGVQKTNSFGSSNDPFSSSPVFPPTSSERVEDDPFTPTQSRKKSLDKNVSFQEGGGSGGSIDPFDSFFTARTSSGGQSIDENDPFSPSSSTRKKVEQEKFEEDDFFSPPREESTPTRY